MMNGPQNVNQSVKTECETVSQNKCPGKNKTCHKMKMKMKDGFRYEGTWGLNESVSK
jgi:hypothetical protein